MRNAYGDTFGRWKGLHGPFRLNVSIINKILARYHLEVNFLDRGLLQFAGVNECLVMFHDYGNFALQHKGCGHCHAYWFHFFHKVGVIRVWRGLQTWNKIWGRRTLNLLHMEECSHQICRININKRKVMRYRAACKAWGLTMHYIWALFLILMQKQQRDISDTVYSSGFSFGENDLRIKLTQNLKKKQQKTLPYRYVYI